MESGSIAARIKELIGAGSINGFAQKCGISGSSIRQYLEGSIPSADKAAQIAEMCGVSLVWLITGQGPKKPGEVDGLGAAAPVPQSDFTMISRLDVQASAGNGAVMTQEEPVGLLAFRGEWLRRRGINPDAARAVTARGDSMEPTIRDGDILLVDTSIREVEDNGIYVITVGGLVLVKRIQIRFDRSLTLISDNPIFPAETIKAADTADLHVAGRVVWFGRSI